MAAVAGETFTSTSAPIQFAAVPAFQEDKKIDEYLRRSRRILRALGGQLAARLQEAGVATHFPHGGFYPFPDFGPKAERLRSRGINTSPELCERLLEETGIAILPGRDFGRPPAELTARIAYVNFDGAQALKAVADIPSEMPLDDGFLRAHCGEVLTAIDRLCEWSNL